MAAATLDGSHCHHFDGGIQHNYSGRDERQNPLLFIATKERKPLCRATKGVGRTDRVKVQLYIYTCCSIYMASKVE